ncbi:TPA: glycosyltransferase family 4 protein, partial [Escherichia coli]
ITKLSLKITDSIYFDSEKSKAYFLNRDYATGEVISFIDKKMVAKKFNNINGEIKFVFIGRLHSQKGVDRALKYIHLFKKQHEEIRFDIYGPDEGELNNIINKVNKLGLQDKVVYKGVVDNNKVNDILTQYDFYLQFSHFEGMAMSVVDAMQVGVIPIVNNVGEIPNYVKNNINGIILDDKKLGDENYLNLNISCLLNIIKNDGGYFLYNNAIKTFQDNNTYVDDYIKKIINANN